MSYLDTSVLVPYYCHEPLSAIVGDALATVADPVLSPLVELELYSAFGGKVRSRDMSQSDAGAMVALFRVHRDDGRYRVVEIGPREFDLAREWLSRFNSSLRALDALHMAAAFANNQTLLTADKALSRAAADFGVPCTLLSL